MCDCQFCGSTGNGKTISVYSKILEKHVNYIQCRVCRSLNQYPVPLLSEIKSYYDSYFDIKQNMNPGYLCDTNLNAFFNERDLTLKEIGLKLDEKINGKHIELGCANGQFLKYLKQKGIKDIIGIDISESLISQIKINGVKVYTGDLTIIEKSSVDNLYLFNIIEHVNDLEFLFDSIVNILKPDANIVIEIPLSGFISSAFGSKWRFLMPDEHLHIPSMKGFKFLLKKYSLKITGFTRFGSGFTTGMINQSIKTIADKSAKFFKFGDRGAFLCGRL